MNTGSVCRPLKIACRAGFFTISPDYQQASSQRCNTSRQTAIATHGEVERKQSRTLRKGYLLNMDLLKSCDGGLADLTLRSAENHGPIRGAAIERYRGGPNEDLKATSPQHILIVGFRFPARFERAVGHH